MENQFREGLKVDNNGRIGELSPLYKTNDIEKEELYNEYVTGQKEHFEAYLNYMNKQLWVLKQYGIVSDYTRFLARIKSVDSAISNDGQKALNDVFGLEVDTATSAEAEFVSILFKESLDKTKEVVHNKSNGYQAYHYSGYPTSGNISKKVEEMFNVAYTADERYKSYMEMVTPKEEMTEEKQKEIREYCEKSAIEFDNYIDLIKKTVKGKNYNNLINELKIEEDKYNVLLKNKKNSEYQPIIECQFKTINVAILANLGSASHGEYKGDDIEKIQEEYDRNGELARSKLPLRMYRSNIGTDRNGNPKPLKLLSRDEMIHALFPSLILKRNQIQK